MSRIDERGRQQFVTEQASWEELEEVMKDGRFATTYAAAQARNSLAERGGIEYTSADSSAGGLFGRRAR